MHLDLIMTTIESDNLEPVVDKFTSYIKSGLLQTVQAFEWYEENLLVTEHALEKLDEMLKAMRV